MPKPNYPAYTPQELQDPNGPMYLVCYHGKYLRGTPTPALRSDGGGEAWLGGDGVWRIKDETDAEGTCYLKVKVIGNPYKRIHPSFSKP